MANKKASKKNIRKIAVRTERNRRVKSRLRTLSRKVTTLAAEGNSEATRAAAMEYVSALDKAAKRNIIHYNKACRHKARVSAHIFGSAAAA